MNALAFDTLAYARRLEGAGFSREQAEALAEEQAKLLDERLATKVDVESLHKEIEVVRLNVESLRLSVQRDIEALRLAGQKDIEALRASMLSALAEGKAEMLKWMMGTVGLQTAVIIGAVVALVRLTAH